MASSHQKSSQRRKLALIIGNGNYNRSDNILPQSVNNANDLKDSLERINFSVKMGCNLDKNQMATHIIDFSKTASDGDLILFYFSGHSYQVDGQNYLIPVRDSQIETDTDVEDFAINVERTLARLVGINPSYVTIMILDCYKPYSLKSTSASNSTIKGKGLHEIKPPAGAFIQFACDANQTVSDIQKTDRNDLFTKHLLKNITQENVHITDIFQRITDDVFQESNRKQRPLTMNGSTRHGQVYLNEVIVPKEQPPRQWDDINRNDMPSLLKKQEELRGYYDNFPDIEDVANRNRPDIQKAERLTQSILSQSPSGNMTERDTVCHVLNNLLGEGNQQCLFFDSTQGMNLHDASKNLVDLDFQDRPFVLKLNSSDGLGNKKYATGEQHDLKIIQALDHMIEQKQSHPVIDDILERLSKAHNIDKKSIVLQNVYSGSFSIVYTVKDLATNIVKTLTGISRKLLNQFEQFKAAKIHPLLYRPSFDIAQFDARGNKDFTTTAATFQIGPPGRTKLYTQPIGWTRYGLKVLGKYPPNDKWLDPFADPGNWYRAFHGTGNAKAVDFGNPDASTDKQYAPVDAAASIFETGFRPARVAVHGEGVYCSPDPTFPEKGYVGKVSLDTKHGRKVFKCMLQVAVNPDGVKCATNDIWVVQYPKNIRTYGILIKEV